MLTVSEAVTLGALERKESRGGHTRDDYPFADDASATVNVVIRRQQGRLGVDLDASRCPRCPPSSRRSSRRGSDGATNVTMKVWRGDAKGGAFKRVHRARAARAWWCWT